MAAQARRTESLNAWWPRMSPLRDALSSDSPVIRTSAIQQLSDINDITAIPALERAFSRRNGDLAIVLIEKLSRWDDIEATAAIARQAIFSRWEPIREFAATKLNQRPMEEYVPQMLAAMKSPVKVIFFRKFEARARNFLKHLFRKISLKFPSAYVIGLLYRLLFEICLVHPAHCLVTDDQEKGGDVRAQAEMIKQNNAWLEVI